MRSRLSAAVLPALLLAAAPVRAQSAARPDLCETHYAAWELLRGGWPLWEPDLFRQGWPTSKEWRRLTIELAAEPGAQLVQASLGSGAGLRLSTSDYEVARWEKLKRAGAPFAHSGTLLRSELEAYRTIAGTAPTLAIPGNFDPVFIPVKRAEPVLTQPWNAQNVGSWEWVQAPSPRHTLEGLGFSLMAEAEYARQQLAHERTVNLQGKDTKYLGRTGEDGFFALIALHASIAKAMELRCLIYDLKTAQIVSPAPAGVLELNEVQYFLAPEWETQGVPNGKGNHSVPANVQPESQLRGTSALLLGLATLANTCDIPTFKQLTTPRQVNGNNVPMFDKDLREQVVELAVFVFRSLRTLHVDVRAGRAVSTAGGRTISPADLGLYIAAIQAFMDEIKAPSLPPNTQPPKIYADLLEEQRKGRVLVNSLSMQIATWDTAADPGVSDKYEAATSQRASKLRSLSSQAFCARGLVAAHKVLAKGASRTPQSMNAERLVRFMERDRWVPELGLYLEPKAGTAPRAVSLMGAMSTLGLLREMALHTSDGRALMRYQQCLEALADQKLYRAPADKNPPSLAAEVAPPPPAPGPGKK